MKYFSFSKTIGLPKKLPFDFSDSADDSISLPSLLINMVLPLSVKDAANVSINMTAPTQAHPYRKTA